LGAAVSAYIDRFSVFPPMTNEAARQFNVQTSGIFFSAHSMVLPDVTGNSSVYDTINFSLAPDPMRLCANRTAMRIGIDAFLCPSDRLAVSGRQIACANFTFNNGWPYFATELNGRSNGVISQLSPRTGQGWLVRPRDVIDGMSRTALASERLVGAETPVLPQDASRVQFMLHDERSRPLGEVLRDCEESNIIGPYGALQGTCWVCGWNRFGNSYAHMSPPNGVNCDINGRLNGNQTLTASSFHRTTVNVVHCDGSVRQVSDGVELRLWWALGSRDAGD
jgi:hypothetical protein